MLYETRGAEVDTGGLLLVDKPTGPTSHDVVTEVRGLLEADKVGHGGTLDPLASGLLLVLVGRTTKLAPYIPGDPKVYTGSFILGMTTDSLDIQGRVTSKSDLTPGHEEVESALSSLLEVREQIPPMYSAAKHKGKPLYSYARKGVSVAREARPVRVYASRMTRYGTRDQGAEVGFEISCSPGTYVRELISRVGDKLGCGATLSSLRRTSSGPFGVEEALTLEELRIKAERGGLELMEPLRALKGMSVATVREEAIGAVGNGVPVRGCMVELWEGGLRSGELVAVATPSGELLGIHEVVAMDPLLTRPRRMLSG